MGLDVVNHPPPYASRPERFSREGKAEPDFLVFTTHSQDVPFLLERGALTFLLGRGALTDPY